MKRSTIMHRMNRIAFCIGVFAAMAAGPAMAVDKDRLDNKLDDLSSPCEVMRYQMGMDMENAKLQGNLTADTVTRIYAPLGECLKDARGKSKAVYQAFAAASAKNASLMQAGKDVYAAWLAQLGTDNGSPEKALYEQAVSRLVVEYSAP